MLSSGHLLINKSSRSISLERVLAQAEEVIYLRAINGFTPTDLGSHCDQLKAVMTLQIHKLYQQLPQWRRDYEQFIFNAIMSHFRILFLRTLKKHLSNVLFNRKQGPEWMKLKIIELLAGATGEFLSHLNILIRLQSDLFLESDYCLPTEEDIRQCLDKLQTSLVKVIDDERRYYRSPTTENQGSKSIQSLPTADTFFEQVFDRVFETMEEVVEESIFKATVRAIQGNAKRMTAASLQIIAHNKFIDVYKKARDSEYGLSDGDSRTLANLHQQYISFHTDLLSGIRLFGSLEDNNILVKAYSQAFGIICNKPIFFLENFSLELFLNRSCVSLDLELCIDRYLSELLALVNRAYPQDSPLILSKQKLIGFAKSLRVMPPSVHQLVTQACETMQVRNSFLPCLPSSSQNQSSRLALGISSKPASTIKGEFIDSEEKPHGSKQGSLPSSSLNQPYHLVLSIGPMPAPTIEEACESSVALIADAQASLQSRSFPTGDKMDIEILIDKSNHEQSMRSIFQKLNINYKCYKAGEKKRIINTFTEQLDKANSLVEIAALVNVARPSLNWHRNPSFDALIGKRYTDTWKKQFKKARMKALGVLAKEVNESKSDLQTSGELLARWRKQSLFSEHRNRCLLLGAWGRTRAQKEIDGMLTKLTPKTKLMPK